MIGAPQITIAIHAGSAENVSGMARDNTSDTPAMTSVMISLWRSFSMKPNTNIMMATIPATARWPSNVT